MGWNEGIDDRRHVTDGMVSLEPVSSVYDILQPAVVTIYSTSVIHLIQRPVPEIRKYLTAPKGSTYVEENFVPCRTTFSTASKKSRSVATFRLARMANIPAYEIASERNIGPQMPSIPRWLQTSTLLQLY